MHAGKAQWRMVSAAIATVFAQETAAAAHKQWRVVAEQRRFGPLQAQVGP